MHSRTTVAVIGGGISGMVAALDLAKAGHKVVLFEKSDGLGGLARGFAVGGTFLERSYHHFFTSDKALIDLARELGIQGDILWRKSSVALYSEGRFYPLNGALDLLRLTPLNFFQRVRAGGAVFLLKMRKDWRGLADVTAVDWMRKWCGRRAFEVLWMPLLRGKFHRYADRISMAWLWARVHVRANSRRAGGEQLGYFRGGFQTLLDALEKRLRELSVDIRCSCPPSSIRRPPLSEKIDVVVGGKTEEFDRVIATVPSHVFANLLGAGGVPEEYKNGLRAIEYLSALCFIFASSQKLSPYYWSNINDPDSPFLAFIQHTNLIDPSAYGGANLYYLGTYVPRDHALASADAAEVERLFFAQMSKMFPSFDPRQVSAKWMFRFNDAQHVAGCDYQSKIPATATPVRGVFLMNFSQMFPEDRGTDLAVRQGHEVARVLEKDLREDDAGTVVKSAP